MGLLGDVYDVSLAVPILPTLSSLKHFLVEVLAPGSNHSWLRSIRSLKLRDRLSILGSLFLFRKRLPSTVPCLKAFAVKMSTPAPDPPHGFMSFITREVMGMFPEGWDRRWKGAVLGTVVRTTACLESSRRRGGARGVVLRNEFLERHDFCRELLNKYSRWEPNVNSVKLAIAKTDGKDRLVSVNSVDMTCLTPFHSLVYDHISDMPWCLRGEAKPSSFRDFTIRDGEVFVSGDYESATDNLNRDVARHILSLICLRSTRVPNFVRKAALDTLDVTASGTGIEPFKVRRGQLMGNALSFPLLCLQNYLAFKFLVPREVPLRINGDDIVFRARPEEYRRWSEGVVACGLTLSAGKTAVSSRWFSLNSTFFVAGGSRVKLAPVIRSTALFKPLEDIGSLKGRVETLSGFGGAKKTKVVSFFLRRFFRSIWWSQRSLRRGLDIRVSDDVLRATKLYDREVFYTLDVPRKLDRPLPGISVGYYRSSVPEGWARVRRKGKDDPEFYKELVEASWNPERSSESLVPTQEGTVRYVSGFLTRKFQRLSGFKSRAALFVYLRRTLPPAERKSHLVWRKECGGDDLWDHPVPFSRCGWA